MEKVQSNEQSEDGGQSIDSCVVLLGYKNLRFVRLYGQELLKFLWKGIDILNPLQVLPVECHKNVMI